MCKDLQHTCTQTHRHTVQMMCKGIAPLLTQCTMEAVVVNRSPLISRSQPSFADAGAADRKFSFVHYNVCNVCEWVRRVVCVVCVLCV